MASRPRHHTVGLGDLAAATLPADSDVVSFRGRGEEPGWVPIWCIPQTIPPPKSKSSLVSASKGAQQCLLSSTPSLLHLFTPLALCCLASAAERSVGKQEHKCWAKPDAQDLLFPRNATASFVFTDTAVSEPLHKTFPASGHSVKEHTGLPRITRYHRRASACIFN